jgi:regulator of protease activity HflC (stomatin/prohibitin superfamily)
MEAALVLLLFLAILILTPILPAVKVLQEHERGVIFRLGRLMGVRGPGLLFIIPLIRSFVASASPLYPWGLPGEQG